MFISLRRLRLVSGIEADWIEEAVLLPLQHTTNTLRPLPPANRVKIDYRPVHMKPLDEEMEYVPPKPRVY